jgi:hypothetical protein
MEEVDRRAARVELWIDKILTQPEPNAYRLIGVSLANFDDVLIDTERLIPVSRVSYDQERRRVLRLAEFSRFVSEGWVPLPVQSESWKGELDRREVAARLKRDAEAARVAAEQAERHEQAKGPANERLGRFESLYGISPEDLVQVFDSMRTHFARPPLPVIFQVLNDHYKVEPAAWHDGFETLMKDVRHDLRLTGRVRTYLKEKAELVPMVMETFGTTKGLQRRKHEPTLRSWRPAQS